MLYLNRLRAVALSLAFASVASADFINGSFESPQYASGSISIVSGNQIPGWYFSDLAAIISNGFNGYGTGVTWWPTPAGTQYAYIRISTAAGYVSQTVSLTAGPNKLDFIQADFQTKFETPGGAINVFIARASDNLAIVGPTLFTTPEFSPFISQSLVFNAPTSEPYIFKFFSVQGHAGLIDAVTVNNGTPTIQGTVNLGELSVSPAGQIVAFDLYQGGVIKESGIASLAADGSFAFTTALRGKYDIGAEGSHWLRRIIPNVNITDAGVVGLNFNLDNGDCDGNNGVDTADYALIAQAYGSFSGDPKYNANADLNGDGGVDTADYAIFSEHFGEFGDG